MTPPTAPGEPDRRRYRLSFRKVAVWAAAILIPWALIGAALWWWL